MQRWRQGYVRDAEDNLFREKGRVVFLSVVVIILNVGIRKKYSITGGLSCDTAEVAFREKCRKIKGCGSLEEDFYTKFKPGNKGFGAVTWWRIM